MMRTRRYPSIRAVLMIAVCAAVVPPSAIIILSTIEHGAHMADHEQVQVALQAQAVGEVQTRITESARQLLRTLSLLPAFKEGDRERMEDILRSVHGGNPEYLNITAVDTRGIVTASSLLRADTDLSTRPHFRRGLSEGRFSAGEYFLNRLDATPSFAFTHPIFDDSGSLLGCLSVTIKLDSYNRLFKRLNLSEDAFLGFVDRNGTRLYFYPPKATNPIGEPIKPSVWKNIRSGDESETFIDESSDGIPRIFGFTKLTLEGTADPYLYVVYALPAADLNAASGSILAKNIALMLGATIFSLACAVFVSERLFGTRLAAIVTATARLREGDLGARVNLGDDTSDLGQIGVALDLMAETIERRDIEKEEYARSLAASLDQKNSLLKEIHHRVKNNLQMVLSLVRLQEETTAGVDGFRKNIEDRVVAMAVVHEMLYESGNVGTVDLGAYAQRLIQLIAASWKAVVDISIRIDEIRCNLDTAVPFGLVLNELTINAFKYAFEVKGSGRFIVSIRNLDGMIILEVEDDGPGLPPSFTMETSSGLGLRLAQALSLQLDGTLSWTYDGGLRIRLVFPTAGRLAAAVI